MMCSHITLFSAFSAPLRTLRETANLKGKIMCLHIIQTSAFSAPLRTLRETPSHIPNLLKKTFFPIFANVVPDKITAIHGDINSMR